MATAMNRKEDALTFSEFLKRYPGRVIVRLRGKGRSLLSPEKNTNESWWVLAPSQEEMMEFLKSTP